MFQELLFSIFEVDWSIALGIVWTLCKRAMSRPEFDRKPVPHVMLRKKRHFWFWFISRPLQSWRILFLGRIIASNVQIVHWSSCWVKQAAPVKKYSNATMQQCSNVAMHIVPDVGLSRPPLAATCLLFFAL